MFGFIKKIFGLPTEAEKAAAAAAATVAPQRTKSKDGKFVADNPATPVNEAWVGGKAPAKKAKKPAPKAAQKPAANTKPKKKPAKSSKPAA